MLKHLILVIALVAALSAQTKDANVRQLIPDGSPADNDCPKWKLTGGVYTLGTSGAACGAGAGSVTTVGFTGGLISVANPTTTPAFTVAGTSGGVPYFSSTSAWASSGAMASGQFMLGGGAGSAPTTSFSIVPLANGGTNCATPYAVNPQTSTYQVLAADFTCSKTISVASGTFTITLVASGSQPVAGSWIRILNYGSGVVTVARSGQNINGATTSHTLLAGSATAPTGIIVQSDGTNYFAQDIPAAAAAGVTSLSGLTGAVLMDSCFSTSSNTITFVPGCLTTIPTLAGPNTFTAGGINTYAASATLPGLVITGSAIPSSILTYPGAHFVTAAGLYGGTNGTNVFIIPEVLGSGATAPTAPTAGRLAFWGSAFTLSEDADCAFATDTLTCTNVIVSTMLKVGSSAAPTINAVGQIAQDNNLWASGHGALLTYDGTASTALVATLTSDTPTNGQVPTWNTGGTITWETPSGGSVANYYTSGANTAISDHSVTPVLPLEVWGSVAQNTSIVEYTDGTSNNKIGFVADKGGSGPQLYSNVNGISMGDAGGSFIRMKNNDGGAYIACTNTDNCLNLKNDGHIIGAGTAVTIASGFGTSPSIVGFDLGGRVTVGTGGVTSTGAITFHTTWATAPSCVANDETTTLLVKATATTTTLTLTSATPWGAADKLTWTCVGY